VAQNATVYKAHIQIADMDRHYYADHSLTLALHPSETQERMMLRLAAFVLFASERLEFTKGLAADDEPDLWCKSYSDEIELWIDVGLPSERRVRKACNRSKQVKLLCYGSDQAVNPWLASIRAERTRQTNLQIIRIPEAQSEVLEGLMERGMHLQANIQDGQLWLSSDSGAQLIEPLILDL
jgi:uncharacterized protein YaeQ